MASLSSLWLKKETLQHLLGEVEQSGKNGIQITISISDTTNEYGNNVSGYISQTKEEQEAKAKKNNVGNGRVFWTDGNISRAEKIN